MPEMKFKLLYSNRLILKILGSKTPEQKRIFRNNSKVFVGKEKYLNKLTQSKAANKISNHRPQVNSPFAKNSNGEYIVNIC